MRYHYVIGAALLFAASVLPASATILHVSESGTFGSATNTTAYSASNGTFDLSYDVDSHPAITGFSVGTYYETSVANFSYTLNGVSIAAQDPGAMFFSIGDGGVMRICFSYPCAASDVFVFQGPVIYSGSETDPTLLTGTYTPTSVRFGGDLLASSGDVVITETAITPEPSTFLLLGTGMLAAAFALKRHVA